MQDYESSSESGMSDAETEYSQVDEEEEDECQVDEGNSSVCSSSSHTTT